MFSCEEFRPDFEVVELASGRSRIWRNILKKTNSFNSGRPGIIKRLGLPENGAGKHFPAQRRVLNVRQREAGASGCRC